MAVAALGLAGCDQSVCLIDCDALDAERNPAPELGVYAGDVEAEVFIHGPDWDYDCEGAVHIEVLEGGTLAGSYAHCGKGWGALYGDIEGQVSDGWLYATWYVQSPNNDIPIAVDGSVSNGTIEATLVSEREYFEITRGVFHANRL
jgi:hypothetical protein